VSAPSGTAAPPREDLPAAARPTSEPALPASKSEVTSTPAPAVAPPTKSEVARASKADVAPAPGPSTRKATSGGRVTPPASGTSTGGSRPVARPRAATAQARASTASAPSTPEVSFAGVLVVESRPPGADVFVDGKLVGITPLVLARVDAGEHAVRLERDGYRRWSASVRIVSGERNRVAASLER